MKNDNKKSGKILRSYPVQLIEISGGVLLKRGNLECCIMGQQAFAVVSTILAHTADRGKDQEALYHLFPKDYHSQIEKMINQLIKKNIIVATDFYFETTSSNLETFYWNFNYSLNQLHHSFSSKKLAIIGVNSISRQFVSILEEIELVNFFVIDYPLLRNLNFFDKDGKINQKKWRLNSLIMEYDTWLDAIKIELPSCLIVTSDFGGVSLMRQWNQFCFEKNIHFFPLILQDAIGYVGPLVVPKETACYECLISRQNSNLDNYKQSRLFEEKAFEGQQMNGFHPSMALVVADIGWIELEKCYGGWLSPKNGLVEINLLNTQLIHRKILKIPRCSICSPANHHSSVLADKIAPPPLSGAYNR